MIYTKKKLHNIIRIWDVFSFYFITFGERFLDLEIAGLPKFQKSKLSFLMCRWLHFLNSHFEKVHARGFATCRQLVATAQWAQAHSKFAFELRKSKLVKMQSSLLTMEPFVIQRSALPLRGWQPNFQKWLKYGLVFL